MIDNQKRREYIRTLASYQRQTGKLTPEKALWQTESLKPFISFCQQSYEMTKEVIDKMK